ncbi:MAG: N-6 DNA methylase [Gallionella sp.]
MLGLESVLHSKQTKQQAYGAYYTPLRVASLLANWAIRNRDDLVLEPCFGGCDFLEAIKNRFDACGQQSLDSHIFGCDIDLEAFTHLSNRMRASTASGNFLRTDFLSTTPCDFGQEGFEAVIGNPPYIKNDRINDFQKESIKQLAKNQTKFIKGRVNLWAYFIVHALNFLRPGGRMAFVLPSTFLTADYSHGLRSNLSNCFARVTAISVAERLFLSQGTEERTVVLLCDGYQHESMRPISIGYCSNVEELGNILVENIFEDSNSLFENIDEYSQLTKEQREIFLAVSNKIKAVNIGQLGRIYIGIVLGDKRFFVRSLSDWKEIGIPDTYISPIVSKFSYLKGLSLRPDDISIWKEEDQQCYFLNTREKQLESVVVEYLSSNEKQKEKTNATFNRREIWHCPDDGKIADAFIGCISHFGPRLVLNSEKVQAANSIYRFDFKTTLSNRKKELLAITLLTTFSQLSAELQGRPLGSGGLKLEPKDISQIFVSMNTKKTAAEITVALEAIDNLIRCGNHEAARSFADNFIFGSKINEKQKNILCESLNRIRSHRHREKSTRNIDADTNL